MAIIGIDGSNIKAGGGLTHLLELITNYIAKPDSQLVLFAGIKIIEKIPDFPFLVKVNHDWLNKGFFYNTFWRLFLLRPAIKKHRINIMFSPGGNILPFRPYVSMSQNMLVFETIERNRFPYLKDRFRYMVLEFLQVTSFRCSSGIIFISTYAKDFILKKYAFLQNKKSTIIYHGIANRFNALYNYHRISISKFTPERPFKMLYVSIINYYKHQDRLIEGVMKLRSRGLPVELHLVGPINPKIKKQFDVLLQKSIGYVYYHGAVPYNEVHKYYQDCDLFVFASTCENMPNILVEAMKANIPVLSSNFGPMPEILQNAGLYFDPLDDDDFCTKVQLLMNSSSLRTELANKAGVLGSRFSWRLCSQQTFDFIESCLIK